MKEQDIMTATQAELDAAAYDAYVRNGESKAAAGRELGLNPSTVSDRIKRHLARLEQDTLADSRALDAEQAAQDAEYAADSEAAGQASPFVADPENPTDDEIAAAIDRSLADGSLIDASDWLAQHADLAAEQVPATEDPDESVTALLEQDAPAEDDDTDEVTARPGPGQAEDNIVHQMACGHEYDSPVELAPGQSVECSAHGPTEIAGDQEPASAGDALRKLHETVYPEKHAAAPAVEAEPVPAEPAPAKAGRFPEGVVTPNEFRAALVTEGIVPGKSVHYLGYKLANENPGSFPARWYAKDGTSYDYDARQPGARLGIHLAGGREWVKNRPAKPARAARTPRAKTPDVDLVTRVPELLNGAEMTSADVAALFSEYARAADGAEIPTVDGFSAWLSGLVASD